MIYRSLLEIVTLSPKKIPSPQFALRLLIVAGVLAWSLLIGYSANLRLAVLSASLVFGIFLVLVLIDKPQLGIAAVILAALIAPIQIGGDQHSGINAAVLAVAFISVLWIIDMVIRKRRLSFVRTRVNRPLIFFLVVVMFAFLNGQLSYFSFVNPAPFRAQVAGLAVFILSVCAFLLAANLIKEMKWLQRITWLFLALALIYMVFRVLELTGINRSLIELFQYGADASLLWVWVISIAASQLLVNKKLKRQWRFLLFCLILITLYIGMVYAYTWKSGWLPPLVSLAVIIWFVFPKIRIPTIIVGIVVIIVNLPGVQSTVTGTEEYSLLTRTAAWQVVLEIFKVNPVLGVGIANYYRYTPLYNILGYSGLYFSSHNNYIDILVQTGVLGLIGFLWFALELGWLGWKLLPRVQDGFSKAYVIGALGGLVATLFAGMLGDWVLPFIYNVGLAGFRSSVIGWLFLGGLVALEQIEFPEGQANNK